jgi:hypothetical protein
MLYKKLTLWIKDNGSVIALEYHRVMVTVSGDYMILSLHNDDSTEVTTEVHHLSTIKNWKTYINYCLSKELKKTG